MKKINGPTPNMGDAGRWQGRLVKAFDPLWREFTKRLIKRLINADNITAVFYDIYYDDPLLLRFNQQAGLITEDEITKIAAKSRSQMIRAFRSALAIDISKLLDRAEVSSFLTQSISDNVDLIKTIPRRSHQSLKRKLNKIIVDDKKFLDQQALKRVLRDEYKSTGFNLYRLTRDQNSKVAGQFNRMQQTNLGIAKYQWSSSGDGRVRPTHRQFDGKIYTWEEGSPEGHPGDPIMCRCVATAILEPVEEARIRQEAQQLSFDFE